MKPTLRTQLLIPFLLLLIEGKAQIFHGTVVDENYNPLINATVQDTLKKTFSITNDQGDFFLSVDESSVLKISFIGYETVILNVSAEERTDTIRQFLQLEADPEFLKTVTVTSDQIKPVYHKPSVNVLDYVPYSNFTLVLKTVKREKYVSLETLTEPLVQFKLDIDAKSFYEDCFGNIHVMTEDAAYQIWIGDTLKIIGKATREEFDELLRPCAGTYDFTTFFDGFTNHQKRYVLTMVENGEEGQKVLYEQFDIEAAKVAAQDYKAIIAYYNHIMEERGDNIIAAGMWDGDLIKLAEDYKLNQAITWYLKVRGQPIHVKSYASRTHFFVFDQTADSVLVYNQFGLLLSSNTVNGIKKGKDKEVLMDKHTNKFYSLVQENGNYQVAEIDPITGEVGNYKELEGLAFERDLQIYNNWLYFRRLEKDYYRLFRIRLPDN